VIDDGSEHGRSTPAEMARSRTDAVSASADPCLSAVRPGSRTAMKRTLRRNRTDLWAGAYLGTFGAAENSGERGVGSMAAPESDEEREHVPSSGNE